jgi:hypothetical protein
MLPPPASMFDPSEEDSGGVRGRPGRARSPQKRVDQARRVGAASDGQVAAVGAEDAAAAELDRAGAGGEHDVELAARRVDAGAGDELDAVSAR